MVGILSRHALVVTLALALSSPALADKKRAYELYEQSKQKYRDGQFADAAALLREAYAEEPDPTLLYNLGRACEGMGDDPCAIDAYERYLKAASPPDRGAIEQKIATMRARLSPPPRAPVVAEAPPLTKPVQPWPWIVTGSGAAVLGAGVVLAIVADGTHRRAIADPVQETAARTQDEAEARMRVANVLLIAGGAVAAGGVLWLALGARSSNAAVALGPASVSLSVRF